MKTKEVLITDTGYIPENVTIRQECTICWKNDTDAVKSVIFQHGDVFEVKPHSVVEKQFHDCGTFLYDIICVIPIRGTIKVVGEHDDN